jgi:hypothetical protein
MRQGTVLHPKDGITKVHPLPIPCPKYWCRERDYSAYTSGERRTHFTVNGRDPVMSQPTITFETKCYEDDWEIVLKSDRLFKMISYHNYPFTERILYINNVKDVHQVAECAQRWVDAGVLSSYAVVDAYADEALRFFDIDKSSFRGGYYYSISELVSLYRATTEYVLHMSSDSILAGHLDWIPQAIQTFKQYPSVKVANPTWNFRYDEAQAESHSEDTNFYFGYGFSDQCYLVSTQDFRARIYNEHHPASERYPVYGGELFEKRVDSWMRNHSFQRITFKHGSYIHQNFR